MWRWIRSILFSISGGFATSLLPIWETGQRWIPLIIAPMIFVAVVAIDQKEYARLGRGKRIQRQEPKWFDLTRGF